MKTVLAIDPGPEKSAFIVWDGKRKLDSGFIDNNDMLCRLKERQFYEHDFAAFEMIACYGMAVGKETFETCVWIGRFIERFPRLAYRVYRHEVKMHLCNSMRAKDSNIRQALIDKHGAPGTKKAPGPTFGISNHLWAALAVADYVISTEPWGMP